MLLRDIQEKFVLTLINAKDSDFDGSCFSDLFQDDTISYNDRIGVYKNNVIGGLCDYLRKLHILLEILVGKEFLITMARQFITLNPPTHGCLHYYGKDFASFIENCPNTNSFPYLADIARLDFAYHNAYYAKNVPSLNSEDLTKISGQNLSNLVLRLRPCVSIISSCYPLSTLRNFCLNSSSEPIPELSPGFYPVLITRILNDIILHELNTDEHFFLRCIEEGLCLGGSTARTLVSFPEFRLDLLLKDHISMGTFLSIDSS